MRRFAILLITAIIIALAASDAGGAKRRQRQQPRAIGAVKKEQSDTRRAIQQTAEQIEANRRKDSAFAQPTRLPQFRYRHTQPDDCAHLIAD